MAVFVRIEEGVVSESIVLSSRACKNKLFPDSESEGQFFITNTLKRQGKWLQTCDKGSYRGTKAVVGSIYDQESDLFIDTTEVFLPPEPTLDELKNQKRSEIHSMYHAAQAAGVPTTPGLVMKFGQNDCILVDGVVRYSELKGLSVVPKLIEADGTEHVGIVSLADGKTIVIEQFEAAYAADEKMRTLLELVDAATTPQEVERISWSMELSSSPDPHRPQTRALADSEALKF